MYPEIRGKLKDLCDMSIARSRYMSLRRLGKDDEAAAVLAVAGDDQDLIEDFAVPTPENIHVCIIQMLQLSPVLGYIYDT